MAGSEKIHMILTKYFRGVNRGHYVIYPQNMKFMWLILWPGGAYTDYTYATTVTITIPYYDSFHESRLYRLIMAKPNEPKMTYLRLFFPYSHEVLTIFGAFRSHDPLKRQEHISPRAFLSYNVNLWFKCKCLDVPCFLSEEIFSCSTQYKLAEKVLNCAY